MKNDWPLFGLMLLLLASEAGFQLFERIQVPVWQTQLERFTLIYQQFAVLLDLMR
jgi:hypothetical protein